MQALQWVKEGDDTYRRRNALKEAAAELANLVNPNAQIEQIAQTGTGFKQQRAAMVLAYGGTTAGLSIIEEASPLVLMAISEALCAHELPSALWVERIRQLELDDGVLAEVKESVADMLVYSTVLPHRQLSPKKVEGATLSGQSSFLLLFKEETKDSTRTERVCAIDKQGVILETRVSYGRQVALSSVLVSGVAIIEHRVNGVLIKRTLENPAAHRAPGQFGAVVACACCR
jgi:hypothetical protein